jgi:hypothetical protein
MRSKRFTIARLRIDGADVPLKYGDLLAASHAGATHVDWECVVMPFDPAPIDQGAYRVALTTFDGLALDGDAVLVRSVSGTHVLRGAGPLDGLTDDHLADHPSPESPDAD